MTEPTTRPDADDRIIEDPNDEDYQREDESLTSPYLEVVW